MFRTINKFHVVNIKTLKPGWHDTDERMLHACFQLLSDFVEKEWGITNHDGFLDNVWIKDPDELVSIQNKTNKKIFEMYVWWKQRPNRNLDSFPRKSWNKINAEWEREDDKYLKELIGLKGFLWT